MIPPILHDRETNKTLFRACWQNGQKMNIPYPARSSGLVPFRPNAPPRRVGAQ